MSSSSVAMKIALPMPHIGQQRVLNHPARFRWLDAGRRWFKTTVDLITAVNCAVQGQEVLWGAPTYDQVRIGWTAMRQTCVGVATFHETRLEAHFPGRGGLVRFRSLDDPDNARGFTADMAILDEAGKIPEQAWYEVVRPMLMTTRGKALVNGTPNGRNWFWRECLRAQSGDAADSVAWLEVPTLGARIVNGVLERVPHPMENPRIAWDEIVNLHQTLPERTFRQEILAEFIDDGGSVIRQIEGCLRDELRLLSKPAKFDRRYIIGLDLAKHTDYTAYIIADEQTHEVVAFGRWQHDSWGLQKARIALTARLWNNALIYVDSTGVGDAIYDDLRAAGLRVEPFKFTASSKDALVENAVVMTEQQQITLPRIGTEVVVNELKALEYTRLPSGRDRVAAPEGMHDDCAMAFFLLCWGLRYGSGGGMPRAGNGFSWEQLVERQTEIGGTSLLRRGIF